MNVIEKAMQLDPDIRQRLGDAMEYSAQAAMAGKSRREILLELRSQLRQKKLN
jgi:hypothetical protein